MIDPLPPVDHTEVDYERFTKNFYVEHDEIKALTRDAVSALQTKLGIRVCIKGFYGPPDYSQRAI